ncbi:efflux transporter outer membrane subunit [Marinomonas pollencensis]|uniref:NodT family efflux transporter outer membrane factor (OMF) lipoprotein n=1 Tax=Marinomonas pollencensis TaxID=491954 RepID=A0A3E0DNE0_9GAMM|nr:efflux transporter outer membrane subunit [Marinomonas pollencensis]REG83659.1 NodT family efflux transporter outer membrane factor (OMF) lipoprotein [Marinomonas pollencensis]
MTKGLKYSRWLQGGLVITALGLMTGCALIPDSTLSEQDSKPEVSVNWQTMKTTDSVAKPVRWWSLFHDEVLTSLENRAARNNLDLQLAAIRWQESRAQLGLVSSQKNIQLSVDGGFSSIGLSEDAPLASVGAPTSRIDTWTLSTGASWEMDFWGYLSDKEKAAKEQLQATAFENDMVQVSLSADIARNYWKLRGVQAQQHYLKEQIEIAEHRYELAQNREQNGVGTNYQTQSMKAELSNVKAKLPSLEHQEAVLKNALAMLLGMSPHALDVELSGQPKAPTLPTVLAVGVPSDLARNRPDILMAGAKLKATIAQVSAANADFYPRIRLTASVGALSNDLSDLGSWDSRQYSVGPSFHLPLFEGGKLRQTLALSEARQKAAAVTYRKTVLSAWHEVENSLGAWSSESESVRRLSAAQAQREVALHAATRSFQEGAADRGDVLDAKQSLVSAKRSLMDGKVNQALAMVALYRSLGGDWSGDVKQPFTGEKVAK